MAQERDHDAELLGRIARGDRAAFGQLYDRYLPLVLRWSLRETGNREIAADLAAETFAAALIASPRYRASKGSVGAWLLGIARNKLRESRRHRRIEDTARRRLGLDRTELTTATSSASTSSSASRRPGSSSFWRRCPRCCARR